ncbi:MAG: response regulator transcription factor [Dehalococcoidia bacterium]|nr:response regulator transcription factor [Dehalococcoidia bacterium]
MAANVTKILIVDDHPMVRDGLRGMLTGDRSLQVVGEASNGAEAISAVGRFMPDIVLMDIRMPDMDGLQAIREIKAAHPQVSVIMVTMYDDPDYLVDAIAAVASGYLLKDVTRFDLTQTLRTVSQGGTSLNPELMARSLKRLVTKSQAGQGESSPFLALTARERQVLSCLAKGLSNKEIAATLVVSVATIKTHVEHIIQKLGVSDRTQAAVMAATNGMLEAAA